MPQEGEASTNTVEKLSESIPTWMSGIPIIHRDEFDQSIGGTPFLYAAKTGRNELETKFREYALALPSDESGLIDPSILVDRSCPLCGESREEVLFFKYRFPIGRCNACGFLFATSILDQEQIHSGYMEMGEMSDHHLSMLTQGFYRTCALKRFEFELQQVLQHASRPPKTYLEIGCSIGIGLEVAGRYGLEAIGVEPNVDAATIAMNSGHSVLVDLFKPALFNGKRFDIVACMDVIEHLTDPVGFLAQISAVLNDDGLALIQVPNAGALISLVEGEANQIFNGLIHYNYFNDATLDIAAWKAGMVSVETITVLSELGKLRQYPKAQIVDTLTRERPELIADFVLHQDWINSNGLGYKVIGIYKKRDLT